MGIWFEIGVLALLALIFRQLQMNGAATRGVWEKANDLVELQRDAFDTLVGCQVELQFLRQQSEQPSDPYDPE